MATFNLGKRYEVNEGFYAIGGGIRFCRMVS